MKSYLLIRLLKTVGALSLAAAAQWALAGPMDLDRSLAGTGIRNETFAGANDVDIKGMVTQSDGKILVVGCQGRPGTGSNARRRVMIRRYLVDGAIDPTFNGGSLRLERVSNAGDGSCATDVKLTSDGKIMVVGWYYYTQMYIAGGYYNTFVMKFNADGSFVGGFGTKHNNIGYELEGNGILETGVGHSSLYDLRGDADGMTVKAQRQFHEFQWGPMHPKLAVWPNGEFAILTNDINASGCQVCFAEWALDPRFEMFTVAKYTANGRLDKEWGQAGPHDFQWKGKIVLEATRTSGDQGKTGNFVTNGVKWMQMNAVVREGKNELMLGGIHHLAVPIAGNDEVLKSMPTAAFLRIDSTGRLLPRPAAPESQRVLFSNANTLDLSNAAYNMFAPIRVPIASMIRGSLRKDVDWQTFLPGTVTHLYDFTAFTNVTGSNGEHFLTPITTTSNVGPNFVWWRASLPYFGNMRDLIETTDGFLALVHDDKFDGGTAIVKIMKSSNDVDPAFGNNGILNLADIKESSRLMQDYAGRLVLVTRHGQVRRFTASGKPDKAISTSLNGVAGSQLPNRNQNVQAIAADGFQRIVMAGATFDSAASRVGSDSGFVARLKGDTDGDLTTPVLAISDATSLTNATMKFRVVLTHRPANGALAQFNATTVPGTGANAALPNDHYVAKSESVTLPKRILGMTVNESVVEVTIPFNSFKAPNRTFTLQAMNPSGVRLAPNASGVGFGAGEGTIVFLGRSKVPSGLGGSTGTTGTSPVGGGKGSGTTGSTTGTTGAGATKNATVSPFGLGNLLSK